MPGHSTQTGRTKTLGEERSKRQERAHRILDAAAELIERWGYKKTAVDDIARLAGVAKGTIYLHWKTREDLFMTLILRESLEATQIVQEQIDNDPEGMYLSQMLKHTLSVTLARPLAKALFTQDISILGELLQNSQGDLSFLVQQKVLFGQQLFEFFRSKGTLRTDQSLEKQLKIYRAIVTGFITTDPSLPEVYQSSPEEAAELMAETIHATLEPAEPVAPEVLREIKVVWDQSIQQFTQLLNERLEKELE